MAKFIKWPGIISIADDVPIALRKDVTGVGYGIYHIAFKKKKKYLAARYLTNYLIVVNTIASTLTVTNTFSVTRGFDILKLYSCSEFFSTSLDPYVLTPGGAYENPQFGTNYTPAWLEQTDSAPYALANYEDTTGLFEEASKFFEVMQPTSQVTSYVQILHKLETEAPGTGYFRSIIEQLHKGYLGTSLLPDLNNPHYAALLLAGFGFSATWYVDRFSSAQTRIPNPGGFIKFNTSDTGITTWTPQVGVLSVPASLLFCKALTNAGSPNDVSHRYMDGMLYSTGNIRGAALSIMFDTLFEILDLNTLAAGRPTYVLQTYSITVPAQAEPWVDTQNLSIPTLGLVACDLVFDGATVSISFVQPGHTLSIVPELSETMENVTNPGQTTYSEGDTILYTVEGYIETSGHQIMVVEPIDYNVEPNVVDFLGVDVNSSYFGWIGPNNQVAGKREEGGTPYKFSINGLVPTTFTPVVWQDYQLINDPIREYTFPQTTNIDGSVTTITRIDPTTFTTSFTDLAADTTMNGGAEIFGDFLTYREYDRTWPGVAPAGAYYDIDIKLNGAAYWAEGSSLLGTFPEDIAEYTDIQILYSLQEKKGFTNGFVDAGADAIFGIVRLASMASWTNPEPEPGPLNKTSNNLYFAPSVYNTNLPLRVSFGTHDFEPRAPKLHRVYLVNQNFEQIGLFDFNYTKDHNELPPFIGDPDPPDFQSYLRLMDNVVNICLAKHDSKWAAAVQSGDTGSFIPTLDEFGDYIYRLTSGETSQLELARERRLKIDALLATTSFEILYNDFMTYELFYWVWIKLDAQPIQYVFINDGTV